VVALSFGVLAALGLYRFGGVNAVSPMFLLPLADLVLVAMAEEMVFRGRDSRRTEPCTVTAQRR